MVKQMSQEKRLQELQNFINPCFAMMEDLSFKQVAEKSGLSETTIRRLYAGEASLATHFGTVQALGMAAGLQLEMTERKAKLKLARAA